MDLCKLKKQFKKHCNNKKINGAKLLKDESKDEALGVKREIRNVPASCHLVGPLFKGEEHVFITVTLSKHSHALSASET